MMNNYWLYMIKANLALVLLFLVFWLFFRATTFHRTNRLVLLIILLFSALSPFLGYNLFSISESYGLDYFFEYIEEIPLEFNPSEEVSKSANVRNVSFINILLPIYFIGFGTMLLRFIFQIIAMIRLKMRSTQVTISGNRLYMVNAKGVPFTFFRWIFVPRDISGYSDIELILTHEKAHACQLHTLDIILVEIYCTIFWFNPFVFLLKRSIKTVHEYLADEEIVRVENSPIDYLQVLSNSVRISTIDGISSSFYWLTLKKRINMITKNKTSKLLRIGYLLLIPLAAIIIQSFSRVTMEQALIPKVDFKAENNVPSIHPIQGGKAEISSGFGMRMHPIKKVEMMHNGTDFRAKIGTPVVATADGVVVKQEYMKNGYGKYLVIKNSEIYSTLFSQLSEFKVQIGDKVTQGKVIGLVGSSGRSTGPHLHYEVRKNGKAVDAEIYIK